MREPLNSKCNPDLRRFSHHNGDMDTTQGPEGTAAPSAAGILSRLAARVDAIFSRIAARLGVSARLVRAVVVTVTVLAVMAAVAVPITVVALSAPPASAPLPSAPATTASTSPSPSPVADDSLASESCEEFVDPDELATALGGATDVVVAPSELLLSAVGGLDCWYVIGEPLAGAAEYTGPKDSAYVYLTVAPNSIADPAVVSASLAPARCAPQPHGFSRWSTECSATVSSDGWWYSLRVNSFASESAMRTSFDLIDGLVVRALSSASAPTQSLVVEPFACASAEVGELPVVQLAQEYPLSGEITTAAYLLAAPATCQFTMPGDEVWNLRVYPGASQSYERCTRNNWRGMSGYPVTIDGVLSVFAFAPQFDDLGTQLCATDGTSTITVWRSLPYDASADEFGWSDDLRSTLGDLLDAVFTAAVASTSALVAQPDAVGGPIATSAVTDGGCPGLFDAAALQTLTGGKLGYENVAPEHPLLATVGGITCHYWAQDEAGNGRGYAVVSVAPSSITAPTVVTASLAEAYCPSNAEFNRRANSKCSVTAAVNGWWYSISMGGVDKANALRTDFAAVTASLERTLAAAEAAARPSATSRFDCESADMTGRPVGGWRTPDTSYPFPSVQPNLGNAISPMSAAAFLLRGPSTCQYTVPSGEAWELTVYPAGASIYEQCTQVGDFLPGKAVSVAGVESAYLQPHLNDAATLCATDGISMIEVARPFAFGYAEDARDWSAADLATLSELLVPAFAAAD